MKVEEQLKKASVVLADWMSENGTLKNPSMMRNDDKGAYIFGLLMIGKAPELYKRFCDMAMDEIKRKNKKQLKNR